MMTKEKFIEEAKNLGYTDEMINEIITGEISLSFLAYNLRWAINILGAQEILRKLKEKRELAII